MIKKIPFNIIVVLSLFTFASCVAKSGNPATQALYKNDLKNQTFPQIFQTYGNYSAHWQDEKGQDIYQYSYSKNSYDLVSQLPIINHFGWIKSENYEVILTIDKNNLLIGEKKFYNRAKSRNSLVCNPKIYSCIRKIY